MNGFLGILTKVEGVDSDDLLFKLNRSSAVVFTGKDA